MQVDTQQNKGEKTPLPDINTWLKDNRLEKKFTDKITESEMITEDLLKYTEDEMKFCPHKQLVSPRANNFYL